MLCRRTLSTPGRYCWDIRLVSLLFSTIGARRKFHERMEGHLHPRALVLGKIEEICINAAQDGLMRDNDYVFAAFQFHNNGLEADNDIAVRLPPTIAVIVLVFIAGSKVLRVSLRNLLVGQ